MRAVTALVGALALGAAARAAAVDYTVAKAPVGFNVFEVTKDAVAPIPGILRPDTGRHGDQFAQRLGSRIAVRPTFTEPSAASFSAPATNRTPTAF